VEAAVPTSTPAPAGPSSSEPPSATVVASSSETDPAPFVLFGTLLFALAAAAGQVLRGDPSRIRRFVQGRDGVRGVGSPQPAYAGGDGSRKAWPDTHQTNVRDGYPAQPDSALAGAPTGLSGFPDTFTTVGSQPSGGLGGSNGGGLNTFANGSPSGFESNGVGQGNAFGPDVVGDPLGDAGELQPDAMGQMQPSTHPTDYGLHPASPADGGVQSSPGGGLGGGHGTDALARGVMPSGTGSELASANAPSGSLGGGQGGLGGGGGSDALARGIGSRSDLMANGSPAAGSAPANSGLGGHHNGADDNGSLARSPSVQLDFAKLPATDGPAEAAFQGGLGGHIGLPDGLARAVTPAGGPSMADVGHTVVAPDGGVTNVGPIWLAAGALARAGGLDLPNDESQPADLRTRMYSCPSCHRTLAFGTRFCGYCGEPMDKTMA